ncbi:MAG TPA: BMC domain-containing protein [Candidatus Eisenbacteria bacterium]
MPRQALGLVETRGLVGAIEAADAMCKTAQVRLTRYEVTTEALVTVAVRGDVASVEAAVEQGRRAAARVGEVLAHHVIPAPDDQLEGSLAGPGAVYAPRMD